MRWLAVVVAALMGLAGPAPAQDASADIRSVISRQIEAFRADDVETAFSFASPSIQRMFGSPERFGDMVRNGYPMVWRPDSVRFSGLDTEGGRTLQDVLVTDAAGTLHVLEYEMVAGDDGWMIGGVRVRRPGDAGA